MLPAKPGKCGGSNNSEIQCSFRKKYFWVRKFAARSGPRHFVKIFSENPNKFDQKIQKKIFEFFFIFKIVNKTDLSYSNMIIYTRRDFPNS